MTWSKTLAAPQRPLLWDGEEKRSTSLAGLFPEGKDKTQGKPPHSVTAPKRIHASLRRERKVLWRRRGLFGGMDNNTDHTPVFVDTRRWAKYFEYLSHLILQQLYETVIFFHNLTPSFLFTFNYMLLIMLLQLSQFFWLCPPPPSTSHSLRQSPHHCSHLWLMRINSLATPFPMLYFTCPWLLCNYLFVLLNPFAFYAHPPTPHLATINIFFVDMFTCIDSVSVLLVCFVF